MGTTQRQAPDSIAKLDLYQVGTAYKPIILHYTGFYLDSTKHKRNHVVFYLLLNKKNFSFSEC
jgi:hypothetical protein